MLGEDGMVKVVRCITFALVVAATGLTVSYAEKSAREVSATGQVLFWREPVDLASRDLFYGPGGQQHQPNGPYTFIKEDLDGTSPKWVIRDRDGVKWKVKLGAEARPETTATRLVWAAGYFANEDYFLADLRVAGIPDHLHRGQNLIAADGS